MVSGFAEYLVGMGVDLERLGVEFHLEKKNFAQCCRVEGSLSWALLKRVVNWAPAEHKEALLTLGMQTLSPATIVEFKPLKIVDHELRREILKFLLEY